MVDDDNIDNDYDNEENNKKNKRYILKSKKKSNTVK